MFTIVVLNSRNDIAARIRNFATYGKALDYLEHNLPKRPGLDMVDHQGRFVSWELSVNVGRVAA